VLGRSSTAHWNVGETFDSYDSAVTDWGTLKTKNYLINHDTTYWLESRMVPTSRHSTRFRQSDWISVHPRNITNYYGETTPTLCNTSSSDIICFCASWLMSSGITFKTSYCLKTVTGKTRSSSIAEKAHSTVRKNVRTAVKDHSRSSTMPPISRMYMTS